MADEQPASSEDTADPLARLAQEIRRRRLAAGLSQPQLGRMVGYTRQYVSLAERVGQNLPSRGLVEALDGAGAALELVLATSPEHRMRPLIHRVAEISRLAQRHIDVAPQKIRKIQGEISDFTRTRQLIAIDAGVAIEGDENR